MNLEGLAVTKILAALSAAATANASAWSPAIPPSEGVVLVVISVGVITGTIDFTFTTNTSANDSGATAITPIGGAIAQVTTSLDDAVFVAAFPATQLRGFLKVIGTIVTGPALVSYSLVSFPKYAT